MSWDQYEFCVRSYLKSKALEQHILTRVILAWNGTFFASNGLEVEALDYSAFAVELNKTAKEKRLPLKPHFFE